MSLKCGSVEGTGRLAGRRILIVGGGQQDYGVEEPPMGNGRAMSILFAREGAKVAAADIDEDAARATAELSGAVPIHADASDEESVLSMLSTARDALGGLDGLVLNVGIARGFALARTSAEEWDQVLAVNLRSHFLGCKHALPLMEQGGSIVLIGSTAARETTAFPAYGSSKAALEALTRHAAIEGAPEVRVNLLEPGLIDTPLGRLATRAMPKRAQVKIPLRRQGTAWEVASGALFLLSDDASYVTGQTLIADGGLAAAPRA